MDKASEVADIGIMRAYSFLSYGVNAANNETVGFELPGLVTLNLLGSGYSSDGKIELSEDKKIQIKNGFSDWVIDHGIQELINTFSIFLD